MYENERVVCTVSYKAPVPVVGFQEEFEPGWSDSHWACQPLNWGIACTDGKIVERQNKGSALLLFIYQ